MDEFMAFNLIEMSDEQLLNRKREIMCLISCILDEKHWFQHKPGLQWAGKRSIVQWAEDIVNDGPPIKRTGPVDN